MVITGKGEEQGNSAENSSKKNNNKKMAVSGVQMAKELNAHTAQTIASKKSREVCITR